MKCRECPLSVTCMAGRLNETFRLVALCPSCGRLFLILDKKMDTEEQQLEAARHGIDLSYEKGQPRHRFEQEYLGQWTPVVRDTVLILHCEQHQLTHEEQRRWHRTSPQHQHRYTAGWSRSNGFMIRPCPSCVRWPEPIYIKDLDEQKEYEAQKAGATPAFRLRGREEE